MRKLCTTATYMYASPSIAGLQASSLQRVSHGTNGKDEKSRETAQAKHPWTIPRTPCYYLGQFRHEAPTLIEAHSQPPCPISCLPSTGLLTSTPECHMCASQHIKRGPRLHAPSLPALKHWHARHSTPQSEPLPEHGDAARTGAACGAHAEAWSSPPMIRIDP